MLKKIKDQLTSTPTNPIGTAFHSAILTIKGLHRIIKYQYCHVIMPHLEAAAQLEYEIAAAF